MALELSHVVLKWDTKHPTGVTVTVDEVFRLYGLSLVLDATSDFVGILKVPATPEQQSETFSNAVSSLRTRFPSLIIEIQTV